MIPVCVIFFVMCGRVAIPGMCFSDQNSLLHSLGKERRRQNVGRCAPGLHRPLAQTASVLFVSPSKARVSFDEVSYNAAKDRRMNREVMNVR